MRRFVLTIATLVATILFGSSAVQAEKRIALVVGNECYANLPEREQLQKAAGDARAVSSALRQIGFEVISGENLGRQALIDKLDEMTRRLSPGDTAFFFFSGHDIAVDGANYILPADVPDMAAGQVTRLKGAALAEEYVTAELLRGGAQVSALRRLNRMGAFALARRSGACSVLALALNPNRVIPGRHRRWRAGIHNHQPGYGFRVRGQEPEPGMTDASVRVTAVASLEAQTRQASHAAALR